MSSDAWQAAFAFVGATAVGVTAWTRMAALAPPDWTDQAAAGSAQRP